MNTVYAVGDIHGEFRNFFYSLKNGYNDCVVIVAGDCGFGFNKFIYYCDLFNKYNEMLSKNNIYVYFIRGNHDDPSYFEEEKIKYERIKCVPDYSIIQVGDKNILCVGGGISVDRIWRKQEEYKINRYKKNKRHLYWQNEAPFFSETKLNEILKSNININCIISHTSPHFAFPNDVLKHEIESWFKLDDKLLKDLTQERKTLTEIYDFLTKNNQTLDTWVYGHFHKYNEDEISGVLFIALDENHIKKIIPTVIT